jgi:hypothetical protein
MMEHTAFPDIRETIKNIPNKAIIRRVSLAKHEMTDLQEE